ncbi:MAG: hypothetical protein A3I88_01475 [Candidatus Portnoybacteria bacterium RIFCSPLOWO2_12_FULL_39_9]|uniref:Uncharacterized protein n=1 Tax=Candidatus Portnoybacteria bacterium RIFCSPHIGHO2_12_FULL_38_9 TaxID=1801997 RepID=A0A1G2FFN8_9BACT|nr:MAG: hypothetical protein A2646_02015 [Candidatus Portnoybacteria bacterium RIFCSPHIGHO2_02_FULL_39_12]OGZ36886.1 MAG: hypothetical protein A3J64_03555 [Candidatus Portnoybacteria bacterium RIFCSPHIGHO2_12_FULL_38_9]OGZ38716.1 MAG: hypothetical protein A3F21_01305 [Candidatus Portnoybacteria bacterium RIFCSPLOWO2_01_FULL_38_39]OGZ40568.1 MAG: hypothetical protein A3I88_01475 [Candidatus Portnoybacteria bacterium RIFCSPLOWO2_12_FULL_39_9]
MTTSTYNLIIQQTTIDNIISEVQKLITQYQIEKWYREDWFIATFATINGVIIATIIGLLIKRSENKKKINTLTKNIYNEIVIAKILTDKIIPGTEKVLEDFTNYYNNNSFVNHPNLQHIRSYSMNCYQTISNSDIFYLLDNNTIRKILVYYEHLISLSRRSKSLDRKFSIFYKNLYSTENRNPTVSGEDIINILAEHIREAKILVKAGHELTAKLIVKYRTDEMDSENRKKLKITTKRFKEKIKKMDKNQIIDTEDLAKELNCGIIDVYVLIIKSKKFKWKDYGKYELY